MDKQSILKNIFFSSQNDYFKVLNLNLVTFGKF